MENTSFMKVDEVAQELGVSKSYAYKIVQKLNEELKSKGFLTISGRVNKQYFMERTCYGAERKELSVHGLERRTKAIPEAWLSDKTRGTKLGAGAA